MSASGVYLDLSPPFCTVFLVCFLFVCQEERPKKSISGNGSLHSKEQPGLRLILRPLSLSLAPPLLPARRLRRYYYCCRRRSPVRRIDVGQRARRRASATERRHRRGEGIDNGVGYILHIYIPGPIVGVHLSGQVHGGGYPMLPITVSSRTTAASLRYAAMSCEEAFSGNWKYAAVPRR